MSRKRKAPVRKIYPDPKYGSVTISKFMGDAIFAHAENTAYENSQFMVDFSKRVYNSFSDKKDIIRNYGIKYLVKLVLTKH